MKSGLSRAVLVVIGLASLVAGYFVVSGRWNSATVAAARSATMPEVSHIVYLATGDTAHGEANIQTMQEHGATVIEKWSTAQQEAGASALDALMIDASALEIASQEETTWLQAQFRDGVVIVGIGTGPELLANKLGLKTLTYPTEESVPIGPARYVLVYGLLLGQADDVKRYEDADWINLSIQGKLESINTIQGPTSTMFGRSIGSLDLDDGVDLLFTRANLAIQGLYEARAEFATRLENWNHVK